MAKVAGKTIAEPEFVTETTPAGIEVLYQWAPKRLYRVRPNPIGSDDPEAEWREVPSVTTVLECLDKPALPWWGMKVGVDGLLELLRKRDVMYWDEGAWLAAVRDKFGIFRGWTDANVESVVPLLSHHKLTTNHVKDKAGSRGTAIHDALEVWAKTDALPIPSMFSPEEQGYVRGLLAFLKHVPSAEPVASEVMVGSLEHGFAGRYDLRFRTTESHNVVVHRTPVRGPQWRELPAGLYLADLKTSKGVYPSHSRQLEAYELASVECGYEPTDGRGVLHVGADGAYEFVRSTARADDFLPVLEVWRSDQRMKERK